MKRVHAIVLVSVDNRKALSDILFSSDIIKMDAPKCQEKLLNAFRIFGMIKVFAHGQEMIELYRPNNEKRSSLEDKIINMIQTEQILIDAIDCETGNNLLMVACINGLYNVAMALIHEGKTNLSYVNAQGETALMLVMQFRFHFCSEDDPATEVALALIHSGKSNPGQIDSYGETALMYACRNEFNDGVLALIHTGQSRPDQINSDGETALMEAWSDEVAMALINTGQSCPGQISSNGKTALMTACANHCDIAAIELINTGQSRPGQTDKNGNTALILALDVDTQPEEMKKVAFALISTNESNPGQINSIGDTALTKACIMGWSDVALKLIDTGKSRPEYIRITPNLSEKDIDKLMLYPWDGYNEYDGMTAMDIATKYNLYEVINKLKIVIR